MHTFIISRKTTLRELGIERNFLLLIKNIYLNL